MTQDEPRENLLFHNCRGSCIHKSSTFDIANEKTIHTQHTYDVVETTISCTWIQWAKYNIKYCRNKYDARVRLSIIIYKSGILYIMTGKSIVLYGI